MPARIVFLGTPDFAVPSLRALAADTRFAVPLVVSQPDRPSGRGRRLQPPPIMVAAAELGIPVLQPATLRASEALATLAAAAADLFVVVAYGEILRRAILEMPRAGVLNVHPSLLPRYRGSSPIPAAILNGDAETGVSVIKLVRALDAGPILRQDVVKLSGNETAGVLSRQLAILAADSLPATVDGWLSGRITPRLQDDALASYTRELTRDDGRIDWAASALSIERLVRAMHPWPAAWTMLAGKRMILLESHISQKQPQLIPGTIIPLPDVPAVAAQDGLVYLERVKPEGRSEISGADWLRGAHLPPDARFDAP